jgi:peptidoglycan L-alanyl-D-glutamate endopeptidase CwlK
MSSGQNDNIATVSSDLTRLAPKFREAVEAALRDCQERGIDAYVYEAYRSQELQALYYARGRTVIPPVRPVTNAPSNLYSWHGYCLAVDVISRSEYWNVPESWFSNVAQSFFKFGCKWGGDWKQRDLPHFQWGKCKPSPSDTARQIIAAEGMEAVWKAVVAV